MNSTVSSSMDPSLDLVLDIAPNFFGNSFNWLLLGILIAQVYWYHVNFKKDAIWLRYLVYGTFTLDLIQSGMVAHLSYESLVKHWGNTAVFINPPKTSIAVPLFGGIVPAMVQIFYAWRIWTLGQHWFVRCISVVITSLALLQSISATVGSALFFYLDNLPKLHELGTVFEIWLTGSLAADILIAATMTYILQTSRYKSRYSQTNDLVTRLIRQVIQTGLVTAITATVDLILFLHFKTNNLHTAPAFVLGKMYSNSLLANLNARQKKREASDAFQLSTGPMRFRARGGITNTELSSLDPGYSSGVRTDVGKDLERGRDSHDNEINSRVLVVKSGVEEARSAV